MSRAAAGSANRASKWRPEDDHYNTPREAIVPFIHAFGVPPMCWEPACGEGAISKVFEEFGSNVVSTTLVDRGYGLTGVDFFSCREPLAPVIVTNPPFGVIDEFIEHALDLKPEALAIFARSKLTEGAERFRRIHSTQPFALQYQFIERIVFFAGDTPKEDQPGWNTEAFSWFVWIRGWKGEPILRWLSRRDGALPDLFVTPKPTRRKTPRAVLPRKEQRPPELFSTPAAVAAE